MHNRPEVDEAIEYMRELCILSDKMAYDGFYFDEHTNAPSQTDPAVLQEIRDQISQMQAWLSENNVTLPKDFPHDNLDSMSLQALKNLRQDVKDEIYLADSELKFCKVKFLECARSNLESFTKYSILPSDASPAEKKAEAEESREGELSKLYNEGRLAEQACASARERLAEIDTRIQTLTQMETHEVSSHVTFSRDSQPAPFVTGALDRKDRTPAENSGDNSTLSEAKEPTPRRMVK